ncbi:7-cyano-7-deazaguanine synthase QueC [Candidatus Peregrinibacteria bacterium CG10_big_fil_rev_8_21_14_0_10_36_19]|nr:MAG: 7-cyano-7-deazaguanine synthase QueC [Candidatus Peregrinibacteria bacterium CG10_big_fil_rev_8_21_14_0_10_36_19]
MKQALIVFSGGQDSTTCLAWALKKFDKIYAITFNYGQRHKAELKAAKKIAKLKQIPLKIYKTDIFKHLTKNSLLNHTAEITSGKNGELPSTFVDGRNHIFLSIAAIYAKQLGINEIITGVCQTDYSGYPDCRDNFIKSLEKTLSLSMDYKFKIHTPLMWLTKKETVELINKLGEIELLKYSHTCYEGKRPACGKCPACILRLKGFKEANSQDPLEYE